MIRAIAACLLISAALPGFAGDWRRGPYDDRGNGSYGRGGFRGGAGVVDRAAADVRRIVSHGAFADSGNRKHLQHALDDLDRFQYNWTRNAKFDRSRLDRAIDNIDHVVRSSRIDPRDRDLLSRDAYALREFRSSTGSSGPYGSYGRPW